MPSKKVIVNAPVNWPSGNLSEAVKSIYLDVDEDNNIKAQPVVILDPSTSPTDFGVAIKGQVSNGVYQGQSQKVTIAPTGTAVDSIVMGLNVNAGLRYYNPVFANMEAARTPTVFKSAVSAAAPSTFDVWAPTAGTKFRVLGGVVTLSGLIAAAATRTLTLFEETAGTILFQAVITIPVLGCNVAIPFTIPANGYLSSTVTKKLQCTTAGATYTTGQDSVMVWGTEN